MNKEPLSATIFMLRSGGVCYHVRCDDDVVRCWFDVSSPVPTTRSRFDISAQIRQIECIHVCPSIAQYQEEDAMPESRILFSRRKSIHSSLIWIPRSSHKDCRKVPAGT